MPLCMFFHEWLLRLRGGVSQNLMKSTYIVAQEYANFNKRAPDPLYTLGQQGMQISSDAMGHLHLSTGATLSNATKRS